MEKANCIGQVVPAVVVNPWPELGRNDGYANLYGFPDGSNNGPGPGSILWLTSRSYSESKEPGTWHWPPKV